VPDKRQKWTSGNGVFSSLNVPPGDATVTARGIVSAGSAVQVIGTGVVPVRAGSITVVQLDPLGPSH